MADADEIVARNDERLHRMSMADVARRGRAPAVGSWRPKTPASG